MLASCLNPSLGFGYQLLPTTCLYKLRLDHVFRWSNRPQGQLNYQPKSNSKIRIFVRRIYNRANQLWLRSGRQTSRNDVSVVGQMHF